MDDNLTVTEQMDDNLTVTEQMDDNLTVTEQNEEITVEQYCLFVGTQPIYVGSMKECEVLKEEKEQELLRSGADIYNIEFAVTIGIQPS